MDMVQKSHLSVHGCASDVLGACFVPVTVVISLPFSLVVSEGF